MAVTYVYKFNDENTKYDTSCLQTLILGGTPISPNMLNKMQNWLPETNVFLGYGMTEVAGFITSFYPQIDRQLFTNKTKVSSGKPIPGLSIKVSLPNLN